MLGRLLIITLLGITLSGCAAVLVGGGAAGGYYVAKDGRTIGEITDDTTIATKIKTKYMRDDDIKAFDIKVASYKGKVTLTGEVPNEDSRIRAIQLAQQTKGVKQIKADLKISKNQS